MSVHWGGRGPGHLSRLAKPATAALIDPLTLSPAALYDASDITTLFQDVGGATPVTAAGQSVAAFRDKSGNGVHLNQSTASSQPTYQVDAGGRPYISFDGSNDRITNAAAIAGSTHTIGIACLVTVAGPLWSTTASSTDRLTIVGATSSGTVTANTSDGTTTTTKSGAGLDTAMVLLAEINQTAPTAALRLNGVALSGTASGAAGATNVLTSMCSNTSQATVGGARIYAIIHIASAITSQQRAQLETWLGSKCGVSL